MAAPVDIANLALLRLGSLPIESLDENSKRAIALKKCFAQVRDIVLRAHPWNFAVTRVNLARLGAAPAFGFAYAYQLPPDRLRIMGIVGSESTLDPTISYAIEGDKLLSNGATARIVYIRQVTETGYFDSAFVSALASRLAAEVAYHITGAAAMKKQMMDEYLMELREARSLDAQENPPEVWSTNDWMDARE